MASHFWWNHLIHWKKDSFGYPATVVGKLCSRSPSLSLACSLACSLALFPRPLVCSLSEVDLSFLPWLSVALLFSLNFSAPPSTSLAQACMPTLSLSACCWQNVFGGNGNGNSGGLPLPTGGPQTTNVLPIQKNACLSLKNCDFSVCFVERCCLEFSSVKLKDSGRCSVGTHWSICKGIIACARRRRGGEGMPRAIRSRLNPGRGCGPSLFLLFPQDWDASTWPKPRIGTKPSTNLTKVEVGRLNPRKKNPTKTLFCFLNYAANATWDWTSKKRKLPQGWVVTFWRTVAKGIYRVDLLWNWDQIHNNERH